MIQAKRSPIDHERKLERMARAAAYGHRIDNYVKEIYEGTGRSVYLTAKALKMEPEDITFIVNPILHLKAGWDTQTPKMRDGHDKTVKVPGPRMR